MKKNILKALVISLILSALMGIYIVISDNHGEIEVKVLLTMLTIFAFSITGLSSSIVNDRYKLFSNIGIAVSILAIIFTTLLIWGILDNCFFTCKNNFFNIRMLWTLVMLSISISHISLVLMIKENDKKIDIIKKIVVSMSIIIDIMLFLIFWDLIPFSEDFSDLYLRIVWVMAILITLGTIITPIINKIVYKQNK